MASWLEKLGLQRPRPPKEELKDFCLERKHSINSPFHSKNVILLL